MKGFFFTGTDTGVGKTLAAGAIAKTLFELGKNVGVMKPFESGCRRRGNALVPEDAVFLKMMAAAGDSLTCICPYRLEHPLAPGVAARIEKVKIDLGTIRDLYIQMSALHEIMLVEGAGGLMVPIDEEVLIIDLIQMLNIPIIIIARTTLGTINHTLLTVRQAQQAGIEVCGVILNKVSPEQEEAEETNPEVIKKLSRVPLLGQLPYIQEEKRGDPDYLSNLAKAHLNLSLFL